MALIEGEKTILLKKDIRIISAASVVSKKEGEGPLKDEFDFVNTDTSFSQKTFEKAESEMVKAVQELESGIDAETVARNHGISKATLYNWKSKYSGMEVSQVRRLKELEEENRKLKQMYAELALDNKILKDVIEKKL